MHLAFAEGLVIFSFTAAVELAVQFGIDGDPLPQFFQCGFGREAGEIELCELSLQVCLDFKFIFGRLFFIFGNPFVFSVVSMFYEF